MPNPADANVVNPKVFVWSPVTTATDGSPITPDDYTIELAQTDANNTMPKAWPLALTVPKADVAPQPDGNVRVPIADLNTKLAPGVWAARAEADLGTEISDPSNVVFLNITPPKPSPITDFSVA